VLAGSVGDETEWRTGRKQNPR